jgi:hypothetical protein
MLVQFEIGGEPAEFRRNAWTGRADLRVGQETIALQSPYRLSTQFEWKTKQAWQARAGGHDIEIVKVRPRFFGGLRSSSYSISVDDTLVSEAAGR